MLPSFHVCHGQAPLHGLNQTHLRRVQNLLRGFALVAPLGNGSTLRVDSRLGWSRWSASIAMPKLVWSGKQQSAPVARALARRAPAFLVTLVRQHNQLDCALYEWITDIL